MLRMKVMGLMASLATTCATGALAGEPNLVRDQDKLHLDVRELINRTEDAVQIFARVDLCARPAAGSAAICHPLATVGPADLPGKESGAPSNIVKYPDGNQSPRVLGSEINHQATQLQDQAGDAATFRLVLTVEAASAGQSARVIRREFTQFPALDVEGPVAERGAIIDRHQFNSDDKQYGGRVLIVLTRKAP